MIDIEVCVWDKAVSTNSAVTIFWMWKQKYDNITDVILLFTQDWFKFYLYDTKQNVFNVIILMLK